MSKKILTIVVFWACVLLFSGCGKAEIDLTQMVNLSFDGVNGKGTANTYIDSDKMDDALKETKAGEKMTKNRRQELIGSISVEADKTNGLSNGDIVKITVSWDEKKAEEAGFKFIGNEMENEVTGLKELQSVDAFADIKINYTGKSPQLSAQVINNSSLNFLKNASYDISENGGIKIGDTITVTVSYSESSAEAEGYTVNETSKEYTVENADAYVSQYSEITEDALKKMQDQAADLIEAKLSDVNEYKGLMGQATSNEYPYWDFDIKTIVNGGMKCSKAYLLVNKDSSKAQEDYARWDGYNKFYLIYEVTLSDSVTTAPTVIYIPVEFQNLVLMEDGTVDVVVTDGTITDTASSVWDNTYRDTITRQKDNYSVEEKVFE